MQIPAHGLRFRRYQQAIDENPVTILAVFTNEQRAVSVFQRHFARAPVVGRALEVP